MSPDGRQPGLFTRAEAIVASRVEAERDSQLSLFSADLTPPEPDDLAGILAGPGRIVPSPGGARLSVVLDARWRLEALLRECRVRDVQALPDGAPADGGPVHPVVDRPVDGGADGSGGAAGPDAPWELRLQQAPQLDQLARRWTQRTVKTVPDDLRLTAGLLRCWVLTSGRPSDVGYLLGLDPDAVDTHVGLAAACADAGITGSLVGVRTRAPAIRIVGHRRCQRLAELVGSASPEAPPGMFPAALH